MTGSRKRRHSGKDKNECEMVGMANNVNSNHSSVSLKKRSNEEDIKQLRKTRSSSKRQDVVEDEKKAKISKCKFQERDETVEMEVDEGNEMSDGEIDSESDEDSQMVDPSSDGDDGTISNENAEQSATYSTDNEIDAEDEEELRKRQKREKRKEKLERWASMENKLDTLSSTLQTMQQMMVEKGFFEEKNTEKPQRKEKGKQNHQEGKISDSETSEVTIYKNAVPRVNEVLV